MIPGQRIGLGIALALAFGLALAPATAQPTGTVSHPEAKRDSAATAKPGSLTGSQTAQDSLGKPAIAAKPDSLVRPKSREDSVIVVKHGFNHQEQIITGSVIMTCLALIMVAMNNYNPR
jgi:hypothetical protein